MDFLTISMVGLAPLMLTKLIIINSFTTWLLPLSQTPLLSVVVATSLLSAYYVSFILRIFFTLMLLLNFQLMENNMTKFVITVDKHEVQRKEVHKKLKPS